MDSKRFEGVAKNYRDYFIAVTLFLIIILATSPLLKNFSNISTKDDYLISYSYEHYTIKSLLEFRQFPLWSPFFNGGYPIIAHPEASAATPWIFLFLFFGEVEGIKLSLILSVLIGALGMFYLTKSVLKFNNVGSTFSSLLFSFCGFNITILTEYWSQTIYFFYLLPLILATFIKSRENKKFLIITSLLMLPVLLRGAISFIILCLFLALISFLNSVSRKEEKFIFNFDFIKNLFLILVLTSLMGMFKILPILQLLTKNIRAVHDYNILAFYCIDFKTLFDLLVNPQKILRVATRIYFGYIPILFCILSLLFYFKEIWKYGSILFIFIILSLGPNSPVDLLKLLWQLPLYHSIMGITEYSFPVISFLISLLSGKFLQIIDERKELKMLGLVLILAAFMSLVELSLLYQSSLKDLFNSPKPLPNSGNRFYQVKVIPQNDYNSRAFLQYKNLFNNIGTINWNSDLPITTNVQPKFIQDSNNSFKLFPNPSYKGEAYFLKAENRAEVEKVTSNLIAVKIDVKIPDRLILNQNSFPGWRCSIGKIKSYNGLLSVDILKKGESLVVFKFMPRSFYIGLLVSLITLEISVLYLLKLKAIKNNA